MIPVWRPDLPQWLLLADFSPSVRDGRLATKTTTGPGKSRRISTAVTKPLNGAFVMTDRQWFTFEEFWDDDLEGGTLRFWFRHQMKSGQLAAAPSGALLPLRAVRWTLVKFADDVTPRPVRIGARALRLQVNLLEFRLA